MAVTPDSRATQAALDILGNGGNAVDALVAAQAVLNVVAPQSSGIGGAGFLLFYDAGTRGILFIDGSAKAPAKAFPEMFLGAGKTPVPADEVRTSGLAAGVPGTLKLLWEIHSRYQSGKFPFAKLLEPAVEYAEQGMTISGDLAEALESNARALIASDPVREIFFRTDQIPSKGDRVVQTDLAKTFRAIQKNGLAAFYSGDTAEAIANASGKGSRLMTAGDLKDYDIVKRNPLHGRHEGYDLFTASPPSAGGVALLAAAGVFSKFNPPALAGKPESIHFAQETLKVTSSVPAVIGDPDSYDLPVQDILSDGWIRKQSEKIQSGKTYRMPLSSSGGEEAKRDPVSASILIADKAGNIVAYTGTLGGPFGSAVMVPGRGFFLNDLLADFDSSPAALRDPDNPNLPGPGQRPRNYAVPVFAFKEGKPALAMGSQGGREASAVAFNILIQYADFKMPCEKTIEAPRVIDRDGIMQMEKPLYDEELSRVRLELWGQRVRSRDSLGEGQVVCFEAGSDKITGRADPRGEGEAGGS